MIIRLDEQQYTNLRREYWHGSKYPEIDQSKANYGLVFITTNFQYALAYARNFGTPGYMIRGHLANKLNIFNARSSYDSKRLLLFLKKANLFQNSEEIVENLKNIDWSKYGDYRYTLWDILYKLGYDGFFNYEMHTLDTTKDVNPSIGLFDEKVFIVDRVYNDQEINDYISKDPYLSDRKAFYKKQLLSGDKRIPAGLFSREELLDIQKKRTSIDEFYQKEKKLVESLEDEITEDASEYDRVHISHFRRGFNRFEERYLNHYYDGWDFVIGNQKVKL